MRGTVDPKFEAFPGREGPVASTPWRGVAARIRVHKDLHVAAFVQPGLEVAVALRGMAIVTYRAGGRLVELVARPGMVWIFPKGLQVDFLRSREGEVEMIHLHLPCDLLRAHVAAACPSASPGSAIAHVAGIRDPLIEQMARAIQAETCLASPSAHALVHSLASALVARLVHNYASSSVLVERRAREAAGLEYRRLDRVIRHIRSNLGGDVTIDALAAAACLSRFHFARAFKASTGLPPHRFVAEMRMDRARDMLAAGCPVGEIARGLNFSSTANFVRAFRDNAGMTPTEFRRRRDDERGVPAIRGRTTECA